MVLMPMALKACTPVLPLFVVMVVTGWDRSTAGNSLWVLHDGAA
jgi:hypothetical protein